MNNIEWKEAQDIKASDTLQNDISEIIEVSDVTIYEVEEEIDIYNFEVEEFHTYFVGKTQVLIHNSCKGTQNPKVKAAAAKVREMHANYQYPGTGIRAFRVPGGRIDFFDKANGIIYELKPNNARAIKLGLKQLDRYGNALLKDGVKVIKILITY